MKKLFILFLLPCLGFCQTQIGTDINGEFSGDRIGREISLSGDGETLAIGSPYNDENGNDSGHVRVYQNISGTWTQIGNDINGELNDSSGRSVSLSTDGSVLAIGAVGNGGKVRVYRNISGTWTQIGNDINGVLNDASGWSVSLSANGEIVAIGSIVYEGRVQVYRNISNEWIQYGSDIIGQNIVEQSGWSVSLSAIGDIIAIGAPGAVSNSGKVRIFQNISGVWTQVGQDIIGEETTDISGSSVSLSADGSILAIGAHSNNGNGNGSGHVRVYQNILGTWAQVGADINGELFLDESGRSVSLSADGSILAVGAPGSNGNGTNSGHIRVYKNILGIWTQLGIDIDGESTLDESGWAVSMSSDGTKVAIGAQYNDGNGDDSGHVRVYDLSAILSSDTFILENFTIFPNPVSDQITINLQDNLAFLKATIYNNQGQIIRSETTKIINISDLAYGTYLIEVITDKGKVTKSFIKK
jgi:Flp pilus assembly pilin Flp